MRVVYPVNMDTGTKPKRYRIEFICPGVISYDDVNQGKLLVRRPVLDTMLPTFVGMPVFNRNHVDSNEANAETAFDYSKLSKADRDKYAVGVVVDVGSLETGWDWCDVMIWDKQTQDNIDLKGYRASCAYTATEETGEPGIYNQIEYDSELIAGIYTHMAIVDNPRYTETRVYANSLAEGEMKMSVFRIFGNSEKKKNEKEEAEEKEKKEKEAEVIDGEKSKVNFKNEKGEEESVPIKTLVQSYMDSKKNKKNAEEEDKDMNEDDEVEVPGHGKVKVKELLDSYRNKEKKNAEEEETVAPVGDIETKPILDERQNAQAKSNAAKVRTAYVNSAASLGRPDYDTESERLNRGASRYGTAAVPKKEV